MQVEVAFHRQDQLGESPVWSIKDDALWWVDIHRPAVLCGTPGSTAAEWLMTGTVGSLGLRRAGGVVLAMRHGFMLMDRDGRTRKLAQPIASLPGLRFNDGRVDRRGRFWAGTVQENRVPGEAGLYRLAPDGTCRQMVHGVTVSNGLAWSPDGRTMYLACSHERTVYAYEFDLDAGELGARRVFARIEHGVPDGATVDSAGCYWLAHFDGGRLTRFDPGGREDRVIAMPVPRPTSCAFGGPGLDTLYVTSARFNLDTPALHAAPLSGSVFAVRPGVAGLPEPEYEG